MTQSIAWPRSLIGQVPQAPAEYLKDLSYTKQHCDHGKGVHRAQKYGLLKVFWYHALGDIKGPLQSAGITHVERMDQEAKQVTLKPEGKDFQNDPQENRDYVEDGVDRPLEDLLLVDVLAGCVEVEHSTRD